MHLSIIIVNWNTTELLRNCLRSIYAYPCKREFEIVVVDNASDDFGLAAISSEFSEVRVIVNQKNEGYARGNNQAIEVSTGDYILLLNPDTEVKDQTVETLIRFIENHPQAGAAGCKLIRPDGRIDRSCRGFPHPFAVFSEYLGLSKLFPKSKLFGSYRMTWFDYKSVVEVDQPMASCLMVSRKAFDDVGKFDEDFPLFFNDVDWCYRAKQKGWEIYYTPEAEVIHHGGASTKQIKTRAVAESHASLARFYKKHYRGKINPLAYAIAMAGIWFNSQVIHKPGRELATRGHSEGATRR